MTLVGNFKNGEGPGHSAIVVLRDVYTFEDLAGPYGDSWLILKIRDYLRKNEWRPVVVQELNERINIQGVLGYIGRSIQQDDDYVGSGVCSSQVAAAIDAGTTASFDPTGIDRPRDVYELAKNKGIVKRSYYYWPGEAALTLGGRTRFKMRMTRDYGNVRVAPADGILSW